MPVDHFVITKNLTGTVFVHYSIFNFSFFGYLLVSYKLIGFDIARFCMMKNTNVHLIKAVRSFVSY